MELLSPRSQAIGRALARRFAWNASMALGGLILLLACFLTLAVPFAGTALLGGSAISFLIGHAQYPDYFPHQGPISLALLAAWWCLESWRAWPFIRQKIVWAWSDSPRIAYLLVCAPFYLFLDRFLVFVSQSPDALGPLGSPRFKAPAFDAWGPFLELSGPPQTLRGARAPLGLALSIWPAMAKKAIPSIFMFAVGMVSFVVAVALLPLPLAALFLMWLGKSIAGFFSGFGVQAARGRVAAAAERLASEGAQDLSSAEERSLRAQSPHADPQGPPRL